MKRSVNIQINCFFHVLQMAPVMSRGKLWTVSSRGLPGSAEHSEA